MNASGFQALVAQRGDLSEVQRAARLAALKKKLPADEAIALIDTRFKADPCCGHCGSHAVGKWATQNGLARLIERDANELSPARCMLSCALLSNQVVEKSKSQLLYLFGAALHYASRGYTFIPFYGLFRLTASDTKIATGGRRGVPDSQTLFRRNRNDACRCSTPFPHVQSGPRSGL